MKIETSIIARRDGHVNVKTPGGTAIVFAADDTGRLVADVEDQKDVAWLLSLGDFVPADEGDYVQAESVLREEAGIDDLPDDEGDENAAPVELATPPKTRARKAK